MVSSDIKNYINKQRSLSVSDDTIKAKLESVGWIKDDITNAFLEVEKEAKILNINNISEMERMVPTEKDSTYKKDPYREPIGMGSPEAKNFISKNENIKEYTINREWSLPNKTNIAPKEERTGQRFYPKYEARPMDENDLVKDTIPDLKKADSKYMGTSFIPKKEESQNLIKEDIPFAAPQDVNNTLSAFKVMPKNGISNFSATNISSEDLQNFKQAELPKESHGFRWFLFILVFIFVLFVSVVFAHITGFINLPISIPFIDSLKEEKNTSMDDTEIFVPVLDLEDSSNIESDNLEADQNLGDVISGEEGMGIENLDASLTKEKNIDLEIKQNINIIDGLEENKTQNIE